MTERFIIIAFLLVSLLSCGSKEFSRTEVETAPDRVVLYSGADESIFIHRCDNLTFKSLWAAYVNKSLDIKSHYYDGVWHRDITLCYPNDSKSEISFDSMLALMHYLVSIRDFRTVEDIQVYGKEHAWVMGEGPTELVWMPHLGFVIDKILGYSKIQLDQSSKPISGFRAHLEIIRMFLFLQIDNDLDLEDKWLLKLLNQWNPGVPMVQALYSVINNTDQSLIIEQLNTLPGDVIPTTTGSFGWGSCPDSLYYLLCMEILQWKSQG